MGETVIRECLTAMAIPFDEQKSFPGCRDKKPLKFDFVVDLGGGRVAAIEYHGAQHYRRVRFGGRSSTYSGVRRRDSIERRWCRREGVPLLVVPHTKVDQAGDLVRAFLASRVGSKRLTRKTRMRNR